MSLKEALDAAHGHEHNEDGSEITSGQRAAAVREKSSKAGGDTGKDSKLNTFLGIYAAVVSILMLVVAQLLWNSKRRKCEELNDV